MKAIHRQVLEIFDQLGCCATAKDVRQHLDISVPLDDIIEELVQDRWLSTRNPDGTRTMLRSLPRDE